MCFVGGGERKGGWGSLESVAVAVEGREAATLKLGNTLRQNGDFSSLLRKRKSFCRHVRHAKRSPQPWNWYSSRGAFQLSKQLLKEAIIHLRPPKKRWWQKSIHTWLSKDGEGSSASSFSSGVSVCACDKRFIFLLPLPPSRPPIKTSSVFNCYRRLHTFYFYFAPSGKTA